MKFWGISVPWGKEDYLRIQATDWGIPGPLHAQGAVQKPDESKVASDFDTPRVQLKVSCQDAHPGSLATVKANRARRG